MNLTPKPRTHVFKLMETRQLELQSFQTSTNRSNTNRSDSTQAHSSKISLISTGRDCRESLICTNFQEIISVIERLQNICGRLSVEDQVSLLCTIGYLRDYCMVLNSDSKSKLRRKSSVEEIKADPAVGFWISAYKKKSNENLTRIRRFKKLAQVVKTALTFSRFSTSQSIAITPIPETVSVDCSKYITDMLGNWEFDQFEFRVW
jgi:hypothetical protein